METVTKTCEASAFGSSRAHPNLNKIAEAFNRLGAVSPYAFTSPATVATMLGMDRAHVTRIIDGKPGFVKVLSFRAGDKQVGYYFMADKFVPLAVQQGATHYPLTTYPLFSDDMPCSITLSDGTVSLADPTKSKPDIKLTGEVGHYPPFTVEALKLDPTRMSKLLDNEYLSKANEVVSNYRFQPSSTLEPLDTFISHLISLRTWLAANGDDPEAPLMLGAK